MRAGGSDIHAALHTQRPARRTGPLQGLRHTRGRPSQLIHVVSAAHAPHRRIAVVWVHMALLLALAAGVRSYRLGAQNFWLDEVLTIRIAAQPVADILRNYAPHAAAESRDQAPLAFVVTHFFLSPEHAEATARIPSALFGIATVVAIFFVARALLPLPVAGVGAILLAISPLHVWYSQEVRWYAQWVLFTTLSYLAFVRAVEKQQWRDWLLYAGLSVVAVYTFVFTFFLLAAQALSVLWLSVRARNRQRLLGRFTAAAGLIVVAGVPVLLWMILTNFGLGTGDSRQTPWGALPYTLFAYGAGFSLGPTLTYLHGGPASGRILSEYPVVVAVFAAYLPPFVLGIRALRRHLIAAAILLPWAGVLPILAFALALLPRATYNVRYTLASLPAFLLIVAIGLHAVRPRAVRWAWTVGVLACAAASLANYYGNRAYWKEEVRAAVEHIHASADARDPVLVIGQIEPPAAYYGPDLTLVSTRGCTQPHTGTVWVMSGRDWDRETRRCLAQLAGTHTTVEHRTFTGVDLWLLRPNDVRSSERM